MDATIPAGEALHHRAAIEAWRWLDATDGGRPAAVEAVFHALPPAGLVSEEGDGLPVLAKHARSPLPSSPFMVRLFLRTCRRNSPRLWRTIETRITRQARRSPVEALD